MQERWRQCGFAIARAVCDTALVAALSAVQIATMPSTLAVITVAVQGVENSSLCHIACHKQQGNPGGVQEYRAPQEQHALFARGHRGCQGDESCGRRLCFCLVRQVVHTRHAAMSCPRFWTFTALLFAPGHSGWSTRHRELGSSSRSSLPSVWSLLYGTFYGLTGLRTLVLYWWRQCLGFSGVLHWAVVQRDVVQISPCPQ